MPPIIPLMPKKSGLKNITRVNRMTLAIFSGGNPGVRILISHGAKSASRADRIIMQTIARLAMSLAIFHASLSLSLLMSPVKTGMKAADKAPKIRRL